MTSIIRVPRRDFLIAATATAGATLANRVAKAALPEVTDKDREHMEQAIKLMRQAGVVDKTGGPFGAVVVLNGAVLAATGNSVMRDHDPSAHAEVNAIRAACRRIGSAHITGAVLYSSCEPCPMCYSTAYWARVGKIFYAASWTDYADLFDDSNISQDMAKPYPKRKVALEQIMQSDAQEVWADFRKMPDQAKY